MFLCYFISRTPGGTAPTVSFFNCSNFILFNDNKKRWIKNLNQDRDPCASFSTLLVTPLLFHLLQKSLGCKIIMLCSVNPRRRRDGGRRRGRREERPAPRESGIHCYPSSLHTILVSVSPSQLGAGQEQRCCRCGRRTAQVLHWHRYTIGSLSEAGKIYGRHDN